jgi:hypothetical protein
VNRSGDSCGRGTTRRRGRGGGRLSWAMLKGKNFVVEEERQLMRSVLAIFQNPVAGNQQKHGAFWERILLYYNECRPWGFKGSRSLESKWGLIKHDVTKFIRCHKQVIALNKSGVSRANVLRMTYDLYIAKSAKNTKFMYEHFWLVVKDYPHWADDWGNPR